MSMTKEVLEILIGKYLDGEIVPSEQRILEAELERDAQAKELLRQLQDLHQGSREAVASEILDRGKAAEEIFEQAWQQQSKRPLRPMTKTGGYMRFAAGLVAGLVVGLSLHFVLPAGPKPTNGSAPPDEVPGPGPRGRDSVPRRGDPAPWPARPAWKGPSPADRGGPVPAPCSAPPRESLWRVREPRR